MSVPERFDAEATVRGFADTWKRVITDPRGFFAEMPDIGGLRDPAFFLVACAALRALGTMLVRLDMVAGVGVFVAQLIAAGLLAAILVLVAQHLFDGRAGFEPTFRAVAYAAAPTVFAWVPRLGVIAVIWSWLLIVRGLERVQGFDTTRAVLTAGIGVLVVALALASLGGAPLALAAR